MSNAQTATSIRKPIFIPQTLYDLFNRPIATIHQDDENTIRLYNGHAVAAIVDDGIIAGWNGNTIGQIINGSVLNTAGNIVGTVGSKKFSHPPYRPLGAVLKRNKKPYAKGKAQTTPQNPITDPNSLEEVLRSGGTYKIPPLKFPR